MPCPAAVRCVTPGTTYFTQPEADLDQHVVWFCHHPGHDGELPPVYSMSLAVGAAPPRPGFGCEHLSDGDRAALGAGEVPEHLAAREG